MGTAPASLFSRRASWISSGTPTRGAVALYLVICAVVTLVAVFSYGETRRRDLAQDKGIVTGGDARTVETV